MFDPKTNYFPYTLDTGAHYLHVKKDDGTVFDSKYPYVDESKKFKRKRKWTRFLCVIFAFPVCRIRQGLRVKGKENLKKYKDVLKGGVVSVCNHIHMWDYLGIMAAVYPYQPDILAWDKNISGENGKIIRSVGGIPVPASDMKAMAVMSSQVKKYLQNGGWLHVAAEGSMWEFYAPIRPFKTGAAYYAYKANKPILPMAFSYRKPVGLGKLFRRAKLTLNIGTPIYPDQTLSQKEAIEKLTKQAHQEVCRLAGFEIGENLYEPIYDDKTNKRIDYYTTEYGVGYKGSW